MKLGELKAAIRKTKGNPHLNIYPVRGTDKGLRVVCQKTELLAEMDRLFPGGKSTETGWEFVESTGCLRNADYDRQVGLSDEQKAAAFNAEQSTIPSHDDDLLLDDTSAEGVTTKLDDDLLV